MGTGPRCSETSPVANTNADRIDRPMASRAPTPNRRKERSTRCSPKNKTPGATPPEAGPERPGMRPDTE